MALIYPSASLVPDKATVAKRWLATTTWFDGDVDAVEVPFRCAYRFDDPAGRVGVETLVVHDGGRWLQVPFTYRDAPLPGGDSALIAQMQHSVLGRRWVYPGAADPVAVSCYIRTIIDRGRSATVEFDSDDGRRRVELGVSAHGTGSTGLSGRDVDVLEILDADLDSATARIQTSMGLVTIPYIVEADGDLTTAGPALVGSVPGLDGDVVLATFEPRA